MPRDPKLLVPASVWDGLLAELHRRTNGWHESGAFLLGRVAEAHRRVERAVYYDDLDPGAYRTGICVLHADSFGPLWDLCRGASLSVVADVHVHALGAGQSKTDRENPMIARAGHLALIVAQFARPPVRMESLGFYEYRGSHRWRDFSGRKVPRCLHVLA